MIDILLALSLMASAQDMHHGHGDMSAAHGMDMEAAQSSTFADVRSVDTEARTALLRHGPLPELGMMGMVMSFHIAEDVDIKKIGTIGARLEMPNVSPSSYGDLEMRNATQRREQRPVRLQS